MLYLEHLQQEQNWLYSIVSAGRSRKTLMMYWFQIGTLSHQGLCEGY